MDHAPTTPAGDDRPLRILERTPVDDDHKRRLLELVRHVQGLAAADGVELQSEFGKEHVSLIVGCNQFVRLFRGGDEAGVVELLPDDGGAEALSAAGFELRDPDGQIFKMFGWRRLDPMAGDKGALDEAVAGAYRRARAAKGGGLPG